MNARVIGGIVLLMAAAGIIAVVQLTEPEPEDPPAPVIEITGFIGGEKTAFMANNEVQQILRDRYNIEVDSIRRGSIEMVEYPQSDYEGIDFVWPSNEVAQVLFSERTDLSLSIRDETIFRSPIVLYSWQEVVDALIAQEIVELREGTYFVVNMQQLIDLALTDVTWADIGLPQLGDRTVNIISTDPTESNSGNMFYGLLLNLLSDNNVARAEDLETHLPTILDYYLRQGLMSDSSGSLFEEYLTEGVGANPIIVGYENQLIETFLLRESIREQLTQQTRVLYPEPTVWSSHPLLAISENGQILLEALQDEDIQRIAWRDHGFRSDIPGIVDLNTIEFEGIPEQILNVLNLPRPSVMQGMLDALRLAD